MNENGERRVGAIQLPMQHDQEFRFRVDAHALRFTLWQGSEMAAEDSAGQESGQSHGMGVAQQRMRFECHPRGNYLPASAFARARTESNMA